MNFGLHNAAIFGVSVILQVSALLLMPATKGFTSPVPTIALIVLFSAGLGLLARLAHGGVELGVLVPLASAVVPLTTAVLAILIYGESASPAKLGLLLVACTLIGMASR